MIIFRALGSFLTSFSVIFFSVMWPFLGAIFIWITFGKLKRYDVIPRLWCNSILLCGRIFSGIKYEIRGKEILDKYRNSGVIFACGHQSEWETMIFYKLLYPSVPAYVIKKELESIPFIKVVFGKVGNIAIDREKGSEAIKYMTKRAKEYTAAGRPVVIFPEGTRATPFSEIDVKNGIVFMYNSCKVQVIPVVVNSGIYWPSGFKMKRSGTIIIEFLEPIPASLAKDDFYNRIKEILVGRTWNLWEEASRKNYYLEK